MNVELPKEVKKTEAYLSAQTKKNGGVVVMAIGGVAVIGGVVLVATGGLALDGYSPREAQERRDRLAMGIVVVAIGAVAVGLGAILFAVARGEIRKIEDDYLRNPKAAPKVKPGARGMTFAGSF